jgi:RNA polymerase sigma-70 factor (ECF subfamily)
MSERGASGGAAEDERLLGALAAGSDAAFETVYTRFAPGLLRAASGVSGSRTLAEDAVQEAFVALVKLGNRVREIRNLRAYLFTAVIRAARKKSSKREPALRLDIDVPSTTLPANATNTSAPVGSERLERALESLPLEQREVVTLHFDGGLTFDEIADALSISVNTASSRYRYALEKLRTAMDAPSTASAREATPHG